MANKRDFKKDVDNVFETVIEECIFTADFFPEKIEKVEKLIDEAIQLYNDTRFAYKMDEIDKKAKALVRKPKKVKPGYKRNMKWEMEKVKKRERRIKARCSTSSWDFSVLSSAP